MGLDEDEELVALRRLLSSGPRTNRARPAALTPPGAGGGGSPGQSPAGAPSSAQRLLQLLQDRSGLEEAQPLLELELRQRDERLGPNHPDTLLSVTCLAMLLQAKGQLAEAKPLYERALKGFEQKYGPTHRDTLISVNNLAVLLKYMGNLNEARPLYERVLAGDEAQLGPTHPHTLDSIYNLARLHQAEGQLEQAVRRRSQSSQQPAVSSQQSADSELAADPLPRTTDDALRQVPLFQRELAGCTSQYGPEHQETRTSAGNLHKLLADMGRSAAPLRPSPTFSDLRLVSDYRCSNEGRSDEAAALAARYERGFDG